jgi:hypothetical protein
MNLIDVQHINQRIKYKLFEITFSIKCFNQSGDMDISRYAELYFKEIINSLFKKNNWHFEKAIKINQDTYDLFDKKNKICIQITSNTRSTKKVETIEKFIKNDHHLNFDELIILFLSNKKPKGKKATPSNFKYTDYSIVEFASLIESNCAQPELIEIRDILYSQYELPKTHNSKNIIKKALNKITEKEFLKYLKLEKDLKQELLIPEYWNHYSTEDTVNNPYLKFKSSRFILRAIDDETYPSVKGNSKWSRTFMYDFYDKGILIWLGALLDYKALINDKGEWQIRAYENRDKPIPKGFKEAYVRILGKLPYSNIVHLKDGDEYYSEYHLYCNYRGVNDSPFQELNYYYSYNKEFFTLELDKNKELPEELANA